MKTLVAVLMTLSIFGSGLDAAQRVASHKPASSASDAGVEAALRRLDEAELQGIRQRDTKFVEGVYAPDVVLFPIYGLLKIEGLDGARTSWESLYDRFATIKRCEWSERIYHAIGPTSAWMTCLWFLEGADSDGQSLELTLRATRQYQKRQGRWLVVHEHFSRPER